jgi:hypothetical protein
MRDNLAWVETFIQELNTGGYADPHDALIKHCKALKKLNSVDLAELNKIKHLPPSGLIRRFRPIIYLILLLFFRGEPRTGFAPQLKSA